HALLNHRARHSFPTRRSSDLPFLTWEWLHAWWTHLGGTERLQLLTVRVGGELTALAPLAVSRARLPWLATLELLGTGYAGSDYLDRKSTRLNSSHVAISYAVF